VPYADSQTSLEFPEEMFLPELLWRGVAQHSSRDELAPLVFCDLLLGSVEALDESGDISSWHDIGKEFVDVMGIWPRVGDVNANPLQRTQHPPALKVRKREEYFNDDRGFQFAGMRWRSL